VIVSKEASKRISKAQESTVTMRRG